MAAREVMVNKKESAATQAYADKALGSRAERKYTRLKCAHVVPDDRLQGKTPTFRFLFSPHFQTKQVARPVLTSSSRKFPSIGKN